MIVLNKAMIDWFTVTTFSKGAMRRLVSIADSGALGARALYDTKRMQYMGASYEGGFCGTGEQGGADHMMLIGTGHYANDLCYNVTKIYTPQMSVSRIDLQITIELPEWYSAREVKDSIDRIGRYKPQLVENSGLDTVYIGARTSQKYARLYVKEYESGAEIVKSRALRFELECKGGDRYAGKVMGALKEGIGDGVGGWRSVINGILKDAIGKMLPDGRLKNLFLASLEDVDAMPVKVGRKTGNTWSWLTGVVFPAIIKFALSDHTRGSMVYNELIDICGTIDLAHGLQSGDDYAKIASDLLTNKTKQKDGEKWHIQQ